MNVADCAVVRMVGSGKDHGSVSVAVFRGAIHCAWSPCPVRLFVKRTSPDWSTVDHSPVLENFAVSSRDAVACLVRPRAGGVTSTPPVSQVAAIDPARQIEDPSAGPPCASSA